MNLYILRHGKAAPPSIRKPSDHRRPLTDAGRRDLKYIGRSLRRMGVIPDILASSPLVRAVQTAGIVSEHIGVDAQIWDTLKPETAPAKTLETITRTEADSVMVVGHEPHLTSLISHILSGDVDTSLKKGGLACMRLPVLGPGQIRYLLTPRQMRMMS